MPTNSYDAIVIGVGAMGSATCFELARRGRSVLGLEQFSLVHDQGSSHGQTRIIRTAYFEDPSYVPLLRRAWERWYELERLQGVHLLTECACLNIGPPSGQIVRGVRQSARQHDLPIESLDAATLRQRYGFHFEDQYVGVLEHQAGFLYVEACVRAQIEAARRNGATIQAEEPAISWTAQPNHVEVTTAKGKYQAAKLIITAGPWAVKLLARYGAALHVMRQPVYWLGTADDQALQRNRFPVYIAEIPEGNFYGFPVIDGWGHKVAQHYGADELHSVDQIDRQPREADEAPVRQFLRKHLPLVNGPTRRSQVCIYTVSPDRHFLIDVDPEYPAVSFAAGFSGHGFKFAPVIGDIMADLAETGHTDQPIDLFRRTRLAPRQART